MANNICDKPFKHKNYNGEIRYCSNDKDRWYVVQKITLDKPALNGLDSYSVIVEGIPEEFDTKDEAIEQIENYLRNIIDSGEIGKFRVLGKRK